MTQDVLGALWFITLLICISEWPPATSAFGDATITDRALPLPRLT
jgi:hypothetical protein